MPTDARLKSTHNFFIKFPNKWELKQVASLNSSDIVFKDFINLYKKCTEKPDSFLVINAILASDNPF